MPNLWFFFLPICVTLLTAFILFGAWHETKLGTNDRRAVALVLGVINLVVWLLFLFIKWLWR